MHAWEYAEILAPGRRPPPRPRFSKPFRNGIIAGALAVTLASGWALAQSCPTILPAPMVTLCPNQPALASDVNGNLAQLVAWLQQKSGPVASADSTVHRLLPDYSMWSPSVTGNGGAGIVNDNTSFQALMVVGNNSSGSPQRKVGLYDDVSVNHDLSVVGVVNAASLNTTTPVTGTVLGGAMTNCNANSTVQRSCTPWGAGNCSACNTFTCSKGTVRAVHNGVCYNTTDGLGGYCWSMLCVQ